MANSGPDTTGSQFFITLGAPRYLDYNHAIFGRVIRGGDVPARIGRGDAMTIKILRHGPAAGAFPVDEISFQQRLGRALRHQPPHLVDRTSFNSGAPAWQAKYLENRLANLARFTGRHLYVRLLDAVPPEPAGQTAQHFADQLLARLPAPAGTILACYFEGEDQWVTAGGPPGLTAPVLQPRPRAETPAASPEAANRQRQVRLYSAAEEFVSRLIDQTDPK